MGGGNNVSKRLVSNCETSCLTYFDELFDLLFERLEPHTEPGSNDCTTPGSRYPARALNTHDEGRRPTQLSSHRDPDAHAAY